MSSAQYADGLSYKPFVELGTDEETEHFYHTDHWIVGMTKTISCFT